MGLHLHLEVVIFKHEEVFNFSIIRRKGEKLKHRHLVLADLSPFVACKPLKKKKGRKSPVTSLSA